MADTRNLVQLIKAPILIALAVTLVRIVVEAVGAAAWISVIFGVAWLHILFPIYFAIRIRALGFARPFWTLIQTTVMWAAPVRAAVALTYVLGYVYQIDSLRFQPESLGPLGEDVTPLEGFLVLPLVNFGSWMVGAVILAAITGGLTLLASRRRVAAA